MIDDVAEVLATEDEIAARVAELAARIEADYAGRDLLLVGVLNGAATVTVDLARALHRHVEITWMGITSYGAGQGGSGAVRLRKDIDVDVRGRDVLIVDGVIDTGLTAAWLMTNLRARGPASLEFFGLFRKPGARMDVRYVGFDVPAGWSSATASTTRAATATFGAAPGWPRTSTSPRQHRPWSAAHSRSAARSPSNRTRSGSVAPHHASRVPTPHAQRAQPTAASTDGPSRTPQPAASCHSRTMPSSAVSRVGAGPAGWRGSRPRSGRRAAATSGPTRRRRVRRTSRPALPSGPRRPAPSRPRPAPPRRR